MYFLCRLKIKFDGWPDNHTYWVDDDSLDIHPVGWCAKTGHPLEPPLSKLPYFTLYNLYIVKYFRIFARLIDFFLLLYST